MWRRGVSPIIPEGVTELAVLGGSLVGQEVVRIEGNKATVQMMCVASVTVAKLSQELRATPSLISLTISACNMLESMASLTESIKQTNTLRELSLHCCQINVERLAGALVKSTCLVILELDECGLQDADIAVLAEALEVNTSLRVLKIQSNKMGSEGVVRLVQALTNNNRIFLLDVTNNKLGEEGRQALVNIVKKNGDLRVAGVAQAVFETRPPSLQFSDYEPLRCYDLFVSLRNVDRFSRRFDGVCLDPVGGLGVFEAEAEADPGAKVAPGMEVRVRLRLRPVATDDYSCSVVFLTECGEVRVPVRAIGARARLNFPDVIAFGRVPVKVETSRTILVKNIGRRDGRFAMRAKAPFSILPASAQLAVGSSRQFTVTAEPRNAGDVEGVISIEYDTGDIVDVTLKATGEEQSGVTLEPQSLAFSSTSIGLEQRLIIRINNNSTIRAKFEWKKLENTPPEGTEDPTFMGLPFRLEPSSGEIWPSAQADVVVCFSPAIATKFNTTAFLEISGRSSRLPLVMKGDAIGPQGSFNLDVLDIDEVYVNSVHYYHLTLENKGNIPLEYCHQQESTHPLFKRFRMAPISGRLNVGESAEVIVEFTPDSVGAFQIPFYWNMRGAGDPICVTVRGSVVPPSFAFDYETLAFGVVSYSFTATRTVTISNISDVAVPAQVSVELFNGDPSHFSVRSGSEPIPPLGQRAINVDFTPITTGRYDGMLVVRITLARSMVPLADCFVGHEYETTVQLDNDTDIPANVVGEHSDLKVTLKFTAKRLGPVTAAGQFIAAGCADTPLTVTVGGCGVGARVALESSDVNLGKIQLFTATERQVHVHNDSLIIAQCKASLRGKNTGYWKVSPTEFSLQPNESFPLTLAANLDDAIPVNAELVVVALGSQPVVSQLRAQGVGCPVVVVGEDASALSLIDFGDVPTGSQRSRSMTLENRGRHPELVTWAPDKRVAQTTTAAGQAAALAIPAAVEVNPKQALLQPGASQQFTLSTASRKPSKVCERLTCTCIESNRATVMFTSEVRARFADPLLGINPSSLHFMWQYAPGPAPVPPAQTVALTNMSGYPLGFSLQCPQPFQVNSRKTAEVKLGVGETATVTVSFDPHWRGDRLSTTQESRMLVTYRDRPQRDSVELCGEVHYPNLTFDPPGQTVAFGAIANGKDKVRQITLSNTSAVEVRYYWAFDRDPAECLPPGLDLHDVFDITPISGSLLPGESEKVRFTYYGGEDFTCKAFASCITEGGPEYRVSLDALSAPISHRLDRNAVDFGPQAFATTCTREVIIQNMGPVPFPFSVSTRGVSPNRLSISPMQGTVAGNEKQRLTIRFTPLRPELIEETFVVTTAYFDTDVVTVTGRGTFHHLSLTLPRTSSQEYEEALADAKKNLAGQSLAADDVALEIEAERIMISRKVTAPGGASLYKAAQVQQQPQQKRKKGDPTLDDEQHAPLLMVSQFDIDFGSVVFGTSRRKTFRVTNNGQLPASFDISRPPINTGFQIEPSSVKRLNVGESVTIAASFDVPDKGTPESKPYEATVVLGIREGPTYALHLRAAAVVPGVSATPNSLDFDAVICGQCKIHGVVLHNTSDVPCDWEVRGMGAGTLMRTTAASAAAAGSAAASKNIDPPQQSFSVTPSSGTLAPGEHLTLNVKFTPQQAKKYQLVIPIKVARNPQMQTVLCKGQGAEIGIALDPPDIDLGAILPNQERAVKIIATNKSTFPVELISTDFDEKYWEEERVLQQADFGADGHLLIPPRAPGAPLDQSVVDMIQATILEPGRMAQNDCARGCIIEYDTGLLPDEAARNLVREISSSGGARVFVVTIRLDAVTLRLRNQSRVAEEAQRHIDELAAARTLTEAEYEALDDAERTRYDAMFHEIKQLRMAHRRRNNASAAASAPPMSMPPEPEVPKDPMDIALGHAEAYAVRIAESLAAEGHVFFTGTESSAEEAIAPALAQIPSLPPLPEELAAQQKAEAAALAAARCSSADDSNAQVYEIVSKNSIPGERVPKPQGFTLKALEAPVVPDLPPETKPDKPEKGLDKTMPGSRTGDRERNNTSSLGDRLGTTGVTAKQRADAAAASKAVVRKKGVTAKEREREEAERAKQTRWIIPPRGRLTLQLAVSSCIGRVDQIMRFAVAGTHRPIVLPVKAICSTPCIDTDYKTLFYSKIKAAAAPGTVKGQYIVKEGLFEFGAVLCGRKRDMQTDPTCARATAHVTQVRLTNNGHFDAVASLSFADPDPPVQMPVVQPGTKPPPPPPSVFSVDPATLTLARGQSQDVLVFAFPHSPGVFLDTLNIEVRDNPNVLKLKFRCTAVRPSIEIDRHAIAFDRVLVGRSASCSMVFKNGTALPCSWRCSWQDAAAPDDLHIEPFQGVLQPLTNCTVDCTFAPTKPDKLKRNLKVDISDNEGVFGVLQSEIIAIAAEAYSAMLDIAYPKSAGGLQFGVLKVGQASTQVISLRNRGKYNLSCTLVVDRADLIKVSPSEIASIAPEKSTTVEISFCSQNHEATILDTDTVVRCIAVDQRSREVVCTLPVRLSAQAQYAKYSLSPTSINFGPLVYGTTATRTFTIACTGYHEIKYTLFSYNAMASTAPTGGPASAVAAVAAPLQGGRKGARGQLRAAAVAAVQTQKKPAKAQAATPQPGGSSATPTAQPTADAASRAQARPDILAIGNFLVTPASGVVARGSSAKIAVEFKAGDSGSLEVLAVDVSDRDPKMFPEGHPFELAGEVCVPAIEVDDYQSIFEEQALMKSIPPVLPTKSFYATLDSTFSFGIVLLGRTVTERVKVINPRKVPCTVIATVLPRNIPPAVAAFAQMQMASGMGSRQAPPPALAAALQDFPFDVEPRRLSISANEHQFVTITFRPTSMQSYSGVFEAHVEAREGVPTTANSSATVERGQCLSFEVRGEATLPQVSIEQPDRTGQRPTLKFHQLLVGQSEALPIVIANDGVLPATIHLDMVQLPGHVFSFLEEGRQISISPGQKFSTMVTFSPQEVRKYSHEIRLRVDDNSFADTTIQLLGDGFSADVVAEGPSLGLENELDFGEVHAGAAPSSRTFTLRNTVATNVAFAWDAPPPSFTITPPTGLIPVGGSQEVTVTFSGAQPVTHKASMVPCRMFKPAEVTEAPVAAAPAKSNAKKGKGKKDKDNDKSRNNAVEKPADPLEGMTPLLVLELRLSVRCDVPRCECTAPGEVLFRPTLMYQARTYAFALKNPSAIRFEYSWRFEPAMGSEGEALQCPFSVTPQRGALDAGQDTQVTLRFAPLDAASYDWVLCCEVPHMTCAQPKVAVRGTSQRPLCHIELEESDYLRAGRRNPELKGPGGRLGPLDPETRVIEMLSVGLKVRNLKRFHVVNPTDVDYEFTWEPACETQGSVPSVGDAAFRCLTRRGLVRAGKKYEVAFEFFPEVPELCESFWTFRIAAHGVSIPFLLVGRVEEPDVGFDRPFANFDALLVGRKATAPIKLENRSRGAFAWSIDKASAQWLSAGDIQIAPSSGTLEAGGSQELQVTFAPAAAKKYNLTLLFNVQHKLSKLSLNVKGEGYAIVTSLAVADTGVELSDADSNTLDFGQVQVNDKCIKTIAIRNGCRFPIDFKWEFPNSSPYIAISPLLGSVEGGGSGVVKLVYSPTKVGQLKDCRVACRITNGPRYLVDLVARAVRPLISFSFMSFDFGPCFLYRKGVPAPEAVLMLENKDTVDVSFESPFESKPHLQVQVTPTVLGPGQSVRIPATFFPRDVTQYHEVVPFKINGLNTVNVEFYGEGADLKVELVDDTQFKTAFGALTIGQSQSRVVKVVNNSKTAAEVSFEESLRLLGKYAITVSPSEPQRLKPRQIVPLKLTFSPKSRIPPFSLSVDAVAAGYKFPLFYVSGAGQGIEMKLESEREMFGVVVLGSHTSRRVTMRNTGDISTRFRWDADKFAPHYAIAPAEGILLPATEVVFSLMFRPQQVSADLKVEGVRCTVEGLESPLTLSVSGQCIAPSATGGDPVSIRAPVFTSACKTVTFTNRTTSTWQPRPVINSDLFACTEPSPAKVAPGGSSSVEVTYSPLHVSPEGHPDCATLFLALPDGDAVVFELVGTGLAPLPLGTISKRVAAKTPLTLPLSVKNWTSAPQRFRVSVEHEKQPDATTSLGGLDYIDVPAFLERQYKLQFFTHKEGTTSARVVFRNDTTGDYVFYVVSITATSPKALQQIVLETPVRQAVSHVLHVDNPLPDQAVTFAVTCNSADVIFPDSVPCPPGSERAVEIVFLPLILRETTARLTFSCDQLGASHFDLVLRATPPSPEKEIAFNSPLGSRQSQAFRFRSFSRSKTTEYTCTVDSPEFDVEKTVVATAAPTSGGAGVDVAVEVTYEPTKEGETRATLTVSSPTGGEYTCPLSALCTPPKPQGPVSVKSGSVVPLMVRNVFTKPATFSFHIDNAQFTVKPSESQLVQAKKPVNLQVSFKSLSGAPANAKLTVVSSASPAPWIWYIKGLP
eukprot:m51a1_g4571 putative hydrocephalus-inducing protein homolog (4443) ;mRNA; f:139753-155829